MKPAPIFFVKYQSAVGELFAYAQEDQLIGLTFKANNAAFLKKLAGLSVTEKSTSFIKEVQRQLEQYFKGQRRDFSLALAPNGTDFQKEAWKALSRIPYGTTISYGEQARQIKSEKAVRAVGAANGRNPISIIVPCHRVIAGNGKLTGYAGGLAVKLHLLQLEKTWPQARLK
jgi:methylated-DNA-[protein]-cysteine S-methyltransferase